MKRPIYVRQHENHTNDKPQFWYTVTRANGAVMLTSETYPSRSNAIRAARGTSFHALARRYRVNRKTITQAVRGERWSHVA